jgi:hypothetical protein
LSVLCSCIDISLISARARSRSSSRSGSIRRSPCTSRLVSCGLPRPAPLVAMSIPSNATAQINAIMIELDRDSRNFSAEVRRGEERTTREGARRRRLATAHSDSSVRDWRVRCRECHRCRIRRLPIRWARSPDVTSRSARSSGRRCHTSSVRRALLAHAPIGVRASIARVECARC